MDSDREFYDNPNFPSDFDCEGKLWLDCLEQLLGYSSDEVLNFIFVSIESPIIGPVLVDKETEVNEYFLRNFNDIEYIQGYMSMCAWVGSDWKHHIKLFHFKNEPYQIIP